MRSTKVKLAKIRLTKGKPRGRPFEKGHPRLPGAGRKKGTPNKITKAVKVFFLELVEDPEMQRAFKTQMKRGDRGALQAFLGVAAHIVGRPKETVALDTTPSMARLLLLAIGKADEKAKALAASAPQPGPRQ